MRLYIPILLAVLFIGYLFYIAFIQKSFRQKWRTEVLPGFFFFGVWGVIYYWVIH
ncbi:MAG: hypothetical protein ACOVP9_02915 [Flavobacterium stagni]